MLWVHIFGGLTGIVSGAVAFAAHKGGMLHRRSGIVFVFSMLVMSSTAILLALLHQPGRGNVVAGTLTFYMVGTALITVGQPRHYTRQIETIAMLAAFTLAFVRIGCGMFLHEDPRIPGGYPPSMYFFLGAAAASSAVEDMRMISAGGLTGIDRLKRHFRRMGVAMLVATISFFLGQPQVFTGGPLEPVWIRAIPVILVVTTMVYWRIRLARRPILAS